MKYNPQIHHRRSIRLKGYDYSQAGLYFITICTHERESLFGEVTNGEMIWNDAGKIANKYLEGIPERYQETRIHEFVVMPNHIHAIVEIVGAIHESPENETPDIKTPKIETPRNNSSQNTSTENGTNNNKGTIPTGEILIRAIHESPLQGDIALRDERRKMLLSKIIGWFKMNTAKQINIARETQGVAVWQRNYYDHIIRNEQSYQTISEYIINNPAKWKDDKFYNA